jgi:hypothetical protein
MVATTESTVALINDLQARGKYFVAQCFDVPRRPLLDRRRPRPSQMGSMIWKMRITFSRTERFLRRNRLITSMLEGSSNF